MKYYPTIIQLLLISLIFWIFWTPGIKVASDFHTSSAANLADNIYPFTWKDNIAAGGLGEYTVNILWSQPFHALFGVVSKTEIPFEIIEKILGISCLIAGFFSIKKLLSFLGVGFWGNIVGTFFYLTNTFFIILFDGGQLPLALGYGILPLIILYFLKNSVWFAFWLVILSFLDVRLIYIVGIILSFYLLYSVILFRKTIRLKSIMLKILFSVAILAGIHAYWLFPSLLSKAPQLPITYERASQVDFLSFSSILHSLFLQQPHWYQNIFGKVSNPQAWFVGIPLLAFAIIFLKRNDKFIGFWLIIALVGIFLSKGSQEPLAQVYSWLFTYIPGFSLFRDPVRFYFLTALAFTVLISLTVDKVMLKKIKWIPCSIIIYFIWLVRPVFLGQMTGMLSIPIFQEEYSEVEKILKEDNESSVVFWIPSKAPLGFSSSLHPSVDAVRFGQKRPFIIGTKGSYETLNFLREAPYMGEVFDVAGVGYIAYPFLDPRRDDMHPDNIRYFYTFLDQLSNLPWLSKVNSSLPIFKTKSNQDKLFITPNIWWVVGSDNIIYHEATKSANLKLAGNGLIFVEEYPDLGLRIDEIPHAKIVLNNKTMVDLAATFIRNSSLIFPAKKLDFDPDVKSGWWKREAADLIRWREFLKEKYGIDNQDFDLGGGWAIAEGNLKLKIKSLSRAKSRDEKLKQRQVLLARVLESTRSGELNFRQDGQVVGKISTKKEGNNIRWFEVGLLPNDGEKLEIRSLGDINVVNTLAILDNNEWIKYQDKAKILQSRIENFNEKNAQNDNNPKVTYQRINPTKYKVIISNLTESAFLVFSQNYDGLWKLDGQTSLQVYSLLNGFEIEKNGQYTLEFEAQKYVFPGLVISGITAAALVLLLIKYSKDS